MILELETTPSRAPVIFEDISPFLHPSHRPETNFTPSWTSTRCGRYAEQLQTCRGFISRLVRGCTISGPIVFDANDSYWYKQCRPRLFRGAIDDPSLSLWLIRSHYHSQKWFRVDCSCWAPPLCSRVCIRGSQIGLHRRGIVDFPDRMCIRWLRCVAGHDNENLRGQNHGEIRNERVFESLWDSFVGEPRDWVQRSLYLQGHSVSRCKVFVANRKQLRLISLVNLNHEWYN